MNKIFKYAVAVLEKQVIKLPIGARIIRVADVDGLFYLWAIIDTEAELENRYLCCYKTGMEIDRDINNLEYLGLAKLWVMMELGLYFFEDVSMRGEELPCDTKNSQNLSE